MQEHQPHTQASSVKAGFIEVDGGRLYYEVAGNGHPLVLFQGTSFVDQRVWDHQFSIFAQSYRVVRYDVRGFGKSPSSTEPYSQADDLAYLLQTLQIERCYLLDLGGSSLFDFVYKYASSMDALILASPSINTAPSFEQAVTDLPQILDRYAPLIEALQRNDLPQAIDEVMQMYSLSSLPPETAQHVRTMAADNLPVFLNPPLSLGIEPKAFDTRHQWLKDAHLPTLLLIAKQAPAEVLAGAQSLQKIIPASQIHTLAHAHYFLNLEQPTAFNHAVSAFLQALP